MWSSLEIFWTIMLLNKINSPISKTVSIPIVINAFLE